MAIASTHSTNIGSRERYEESIYRRVVVVGPSGSGKTRIAEELCRITHLRYVALDELNWETESIRVDQETFRSRVAAAVSGETWLVDGHYPQSRDLVWSRAQMVVWLDYSFATCFFHLLKRHGTSYVNLREPARTFKKNSWQRYLPAAVIQRYVRRIIRTVRCRREQRDTFEQLLEYPNLRVVRLRSPQETELWLQHFRAGETI